MKKLVLNNIDCILLDGVDPNLSAKTINKVNSILGFRSIKLLTFQKPEVELDSPIEFIQIRKLSYVEYATFCLKELKDYVNSDFCLTIQPDGYAYNPSKWDDKFLKYDYIGGCFWPGTLSNGARVGNSGFCIRSKKLLDRLSKTDIIHSGENDDVVICQKYKSLLEGEGYKFASIEDAAQFSWSGDIPEFPVNRYTDVFGGHYQELLLEKK